jgi:hypothetical protein
LCRLKGPRQQQKKVFWFFSSEKNIFLPFPHHSTPPQPKVTGLAARCTRGILTSARRRSIMVDRPPGADDWVHSAFGVHPAVVQNAVAGAPPPAAQAAPLPGPRADPPPDVSKMNMQGVLVALDKLNKAGELDTVTIPSGDARLNVALLTVRQKLGEKWSALMEKLPEADQEAVRAFAMIKMDAGDTKVPPVKPNARGEVMKDDDLDDKSWTQKLLKFHDLGPNLLGHSAKTAVLDGKTMEVDDIIDFVVDQAAATRSFPIDRAVVRGIVKGVVGTQAMKTVVMDAVQSKTRVSGAISFGFSPGMHHKDLDTGAQSKDNKTYQIAGQVTLEIHPENGSGIELSWVVQATGFKGDDSGSDKFNWSALTGPQIAWVQSFFDGLLKVEPFIQALGGAGTATQAQTGQLKLVQVGQVAGGGQLVFTVPKTSGKLSFGVQATAGLTGAGGANTTFDWGAQGFAQWNF